MTRYFSPDASKPGVTLTGGQVTARTASPAGPSYSNAAHGAARAAAGRTREDHHHPAAAHIEDDGLVTVYPPMGQPRNHAEEIANALAYVDQRRRVEEKARINFEMECG